MTQTLSLAALIAFLKARSQIAALVSARVYRGNGAPQDELRTRIVCHGNISRVRPGVLDQEASGLVVERFQLNCWGGGTSPGLASEKLAAAIQQRYADGGINGFKGTITYTDDESVSHTLTVLRLQVGNASDLAESYTATNQLGSDGVAVDVEMTYRE